ncbi:hypothetical protein RCL1_000780 [Eukaryota sp. TZLM3-RCL]
MTSRDVCLIDCSGFSFKLLFLVCYRKIMVTGKRSLGVCNLPWVNNAVVVGIKLEDCDRVNFTPLAWVSQVNWSPVMLSLAINNNHFLATNLKEGSVVSINVTTPEMYRHVDACGLVSGRKVDKSNRFAYELVQNAPLLNDSPVSIIAKMVTKVPNATNSVFIFDVVEIFAKEQVLDNSGKVVLSKCDPLIFSFDQPSYYKLGEALPLKPWEAGRDL